METKRIEEVVMHNMMGRGFGIVAQSINALSYESDILGVNRNGYIYEYEIKQSRADFKAEFRNKPHKHYLLSDRISHKDYGRGGGNVIFIPNRFFFLCVDDLLTIDDIPEYAGLIQIHEKPLEITVVKEAPLLHRIKASEDFYRSLATKLSHRLLLGCAYLTYKNNQNSAANVYT